MSAREQDPPSGNLPTDAFSVALRQATDNPGAARSSSTVNLIDFWGRSESWIVDTFRHDGRDVVFLQRMSAEGSFRLVVPAEVTAALSRQRGSTVGQTRRRTARAVVEDRRAKGHKLGNVEALRKARRRRKAVTR